MKLNPQIDKFVENLMLLNQPNEYLEKRGYKRDIISRDFANVCRELFNESIESEDRQLLRNAIQQATRSNNRGNEITALMDFARYIQPTTAIENYMQDIVYSLLWLMRELHAGNLNDSMLARKKDDVQRTFASLVNYMTMEMRISSNGNEELQRFLDR